MDLQAAPPAGREPPRPQALCSDPAATSTSTPAPAPAAGCPPSAPPPPLFLLDPTLRWVRTRTSRWLRPPLRGHGSSFIISSSSSGRVRTRRTSAGTGATATDGRSRGKVVSQSQRELRDPTSRLVVPVHSDPVLLVLAGSRSGSPGRLLSSTYGRILRPAAGSSGAPCSVSDKTRPRGHRSQGCSRETSPSRTAAGKNRC